MGFQCLRHPANDVGSCASVWVDAGRNLVKRIFRPGLPLVSGRLSDTSSQQLKTLFENELYWLKLLGSSGLVAPVVEIDSERLEITQEYLGPDLLWESLTSGLTKSRIEVAQTQILEGFGRLINEFEVLKLNGSMSNLVFRDRIYFIDFKWATPLAKAHLPAQNPLHKLSTVLDDEYYSYDVYLTKLSIELGQALRAQLDRKLGAIVESGRG